MIQKFTQQISADLESDAYTNIRNYMVHQSIVHGGEKRGYAYEAKNAALQLFNSKTL